jgi:ribosomal protein S7
MARLSKVVVVERENFVRELFRSSPGLSGAEVQAKLVATYGRMMRPNRIYDLKKEVAAEILQTAVATVETEAVVTPTTATVEVTAETVPAVELSASLVLGEDGLPTFKTA